MSDSQEINLAGSNEDIAKWVWNTLVPKSGQADSLQGEMLRAIERLRWEAQENGNVNWDKGFERFIDFLQGTLGKEERFPKEIKVSITSDLQRLKRSQIPYTKDDLYDRLVECLILFCRHHPQIIPQSHDAKQHR